MTEESDEMQSKGDIISMEHSYALLRAIAFGVNMQVTEDVVEDGNVVVGGKEK